MITDSDIVGISSILLPCIMYHSLPRGMFLRFVPGQLALPLLGLKLALAKKEGKKDMWILIIEKL
jgi:hypothetical protein